MSATSHLVDRVRRLAARMPSPRRAPQTRAADLAVGSAVRYCGDPYAVVNIANFTDTVLVTLVNRSDVYTIEYHPDELVETP